MTTDRRVIGRHTIGDDGTIDLDEDVLAASDLEPGGDCLIIATEGGGGLTVMPVTEDFSPSPSGQ
jgi:hypothetical protein